MQRHFTGSLLSLLLPTAVLAQVPPGQAINGTISSTSTPLMLVPTTGGPSTITGSAQATVNAVAIDPINSSIWLAPVTTNAPLVHAFMSGPNTIISETTLASPITGGSIAGIAFDIDCNPVIAGGTVSAAGGVFRIDRNSGTVTQLIGVGSGILGIANGIDSDPATGDIYFCTFGAGAGNVYRISQPTYGTATLIGTAPNTNLSGVTFGRTPAAPLGTLWLSSFSSPFLFETDVLNGTTAPRPGTPAFASLNWVDFDDTNLSLWLNANSARNLYTSDLLGNNVVVGQVPTGVPAAIEINDVNPRAAALTVCPNLMPAAPAPITLELGVAGNPGEFAVVAVIAPFVAVLGSGPVDAGGKFSVSFGGVIGAAGSPGSVRFLAATIDLTTLGVKISNPYSWPLN